MTDLAKIGPATRGATPGERARIRLLHVVGTRPNFMKVAAVIGAAERWNQTQATTSGSAPLFDQVLVHTGQHYDEKMCKLIFEDLGLPRPDYDLEVGSGTHAEQTAKIMLALEPVIVREAPDLVVTVGDVNSTMAAALVASKLHIAVAHVEAGLRSRDRSMPEELNRLVTDQLSDLLFTTSRDADANLLAEGLPAERIHFVGNTMIDSLQTNLKRALDTTVVTDLGLPPQAYAVATLHRPSNVDTPEELARLVRVLEEVGRRLPVVFPAHARTRERLRRFGLHDQLHGSTDAKETRSGSPGSDTRVLMCEPLSYLEFLGLMARARLVLTDSGGIQEETTVLGVPCLTLRKNTERPVTITYGTNRLVDPDDSEAILAAVDSLLTAAPPVNNSKPCPELWDGRAGERIVETVIRWATAGVSGE